MSAASSDISTGRLIQDEAHGGEFNMAADLYLSQEAGKSGQVILRLYGWDLPTLSLGFHQKFDDILRHSYAARGIPIVRRPTGGRAVLHDQELTYCLAIPVGHRLVMDGKDKLQESIGRAFVEAGCMIGLHPQLVRRGVDDQGAQIHFASGSPLCFDSISRWEVRLNGRKWIGSAQRILPGSYLQHGSILLTDCNQNEISRLDGNSRPIDPARLRDALAQSLENTLHLVWQEQGWMEFELAQINNHLSIPEDNLPKLAS